MACVCLCVCVLMLHTHIILLRTELHLCRLLSENFPNNGLLASRTSPSKQYSFFGAV